jgi:hypothetical protein
MPEHEPGDGLPAADGLRVDVWRGDFSVGDSLVLCSRNLVGVVGTEELKNAVVTLHPQSAVEHLHHLFVAAGGQGSDAVLAIEASEVSLARVEHRLVPVTPSEPLAGAEPRSPIPLADQFAGAAAAVSDRAGAARGAMRDAFSGGLNSLLDLMPQRRTTLRRIVPAANRRETQRRAAMAVLAFLGVVAILGVALWAWGGPLRGSEDAAPLITEGEQAYGAARDKADQVLGSANMLANDRPGAQRLLREAWADLDRAAEAGVDAAAIGQLRARLATGLDQLYSTYRATSAPVFSVAEGTEISGLTTRRTSSSAGPWSASTPGRVRRRSSSAWATGAATESVRRPFWHAAAPTCWSSTSAASSGGGARQTRSAAEPWARSASAANRRGATTWSTCARS